MVCGISLAGNRYRHVMLKLDLWELPQRRHTDTITAEVERNFYSRCPSNKRPAFTHRLPSDTSLSDSELSKSESISAVSEEKGDGPGNVEPSTEQTTKKYDESLFKALHNTFIKRIWGSAILLVISGERKYAFRNVLVFL
jgi:ATP-binding cassette subfamily C (CFTR/MRP) protein 1